MCTVLWEVASTYKDHATLSWAERQADREYPKGERGRRREELSDTFPREVPSLFALPGGRRWSLFSFPSHHFLKAANFAPFLLPEWGKVLSESPKIRLIGLPRLTLTKQDD